MTENLLYLCPKDFNTVPKDTHALMEALTQTGFIADRFSFGEEEHFQPGEEFLTLITFLGCSPVISLGEPGKTGDEFSHIAFEGPHESPHFVGGDNLKIPRCPGCGHRFESWQEMIAKWQQTPETTITCPDCGRELTPMQLRWRKSAGFGRFFIKVWGIFESEAVPNPNLLSVLEKSTGSPWQHFYIRRI